MYEDTCTRFRPFPRIPRTSTPISVVPIPPTPPLILPPPITTAAIEYNSWTSPSVGCPEITRDVRMTPATPANRPLVTYTSIL